MVELEIAHEAKPMRRNTAAKLLLACVALVAVWSTIQLARHPTRLRASLGRDDEYAGHVFSQDGKTLLVTELNPPVASPFPKPRAGPYRFRLWDVTTGRESRRLYSDFHLVSEVALSPDGRFLAV